MNREAMVTGDSGHPARAAREELVAALTAAAGAESLITDPQAIEPFLHDQRGWYHGRAPLVLAPKNVEAVAAAVGVCHRAGVPVVPQGGNTGLVGGSVPDESGTQVVLSLSRLNRIRDLDPLDGTVTVEAGCVLASVQEAAAQAGMLFPLSLAAQGSCQVGGNLSTNAGGTAVIRYGNARDLVLGLEVVLPDGRLWDGLRRLRKNNTGYDLKQLFIGAEGTLGIITAAVLKLYPRPRQRETAFIALDSAEAALGLLRTMREACGEAITTFEYIDRASLAAALENVPGNRDPFATVYPHYVLAELSSARPGGELRAALEGVLGEALEDGTVHDAVIAESEAQSETLWRLRETMPEGVKRHGIGLKHDVSVPVSQVPRFLAEARAQLGRMLPGLTVFAFGHLGDGNIHFNLAPSAEVEATRLLERGEELTRTVYDLAHGLGGSFSAEHGVGRLKRAELLRYKAAIEIDLMRTLKRAFDPTGIMNPGKIL